MKKTIAIISLLISPMLVSAEPICGTIKKLTVTNFAGVPAQVEFEDGRIVQVQGAGSTITSPILNTAFVTKAKFCMESEKGPFSVEH